MFEALSSRKDVKVSNRQSFVLPSTKMRIWSGVNHGFSWDLNIDAKFSLNLVARRFSTPDFRLCMNPVAQLTLKNSLRFIHAFFYNQRAATQIDSDFAPNPKTEFIHSVSGSRRPRRSCTTEICIVRWR